MASGCDSGQFVFPPSKPVAQRVENSTNSPRSWADPVGRDEYYLQCSDPISLHLRLANAEPGEKPLETGSGLQG